MTLLTPKAIGLFGGTFDPFHLGHLRVLTAVYSNVPLKEIRLIPCAKPLLRRMPVASAKQRLDMLKEIAKDYSWLKVDDREIRRGGFSYTLETVSALRQEMPQTPLCFLMSIDQFSKFDHWHDWEKILDCVHLIVTNRPDWSFSPNPTIKEVLKQHQTTDRQLLNHTLGGAIFFQTIDALAISSTDIRARLKTDQAVQNLLPEKVLRYIMQRRLYK